LEDVVVVRLPSSVVGRPSRAEPRNHHKNASDFGPGGARRNPCGASWGSKRVILSMVGFDATNIGLILHC
jgi:hypothetical protein